MKNSLKFPNSRMYAVNTALALLRPSWWSFLVTVPPIEAIVEFQMACALCTRICYDTHGDRDQAKVQQFLGAPSFFKLVADKKIHTNGFFLRIPPRFMEAYGYRIKDTVSLRGPTGYVCELRLGYDKGLGFRAGFGEFLAYHSIETGDHILFTLIANSQFAVKVYGKFGCEKVIPPVTNPNNHRGRVYIDSKPSMEAVIPSPHNDHDGLLARPSIYTPSNVLHTSSLFPRPHTNHQSGKQSVNLKNIASCMKVLRKRGHAAKLGQNLKHRREEEGDEHLLRLEDEGMIKAGHGNVWVGRKGDDKGKRGFSMLEQSSSPLPISKMARKGVISQQAGEHDNLEMREGGLNYVFPQVQPKRAEADPEALARHTEQDSLTPQRFANPERCLSPESKRRSAEIEDLIDIGADFGSSRGLRQPEHDSEVPGVLLPASRTEVSPKVPAGNRVKALEAARAHTTSNPSVILIMTKTYTSGFLHFPAAFAKKWFPQANTELLLVDTAGKHWPVIWYPNHSHTRLNVGWRQFSQAQNLKEGDVCVFELRNPIRITFVVHIFRVVNSACIGNEGHSHEQAVIGRVRLEGYCSGNCGNGIVQSTNILDEKDSRLSGKSSNVDKWTKPSTSKKDASISPEHAAGVASKSGRSCNPGEDVCRSIAPNSPIKSITAAQFYAGQRGMVVNVLAAEEKSQEESKGDSAEERGPALVQQQGTAASERKRRFHKISQGRQSTNSMRQKALDAANALQTSNPHIALVMKPSHVGAGFSVFLPGTFMTPDKSMNVTLVDSSGKSWSARWVVTAVGKRLSAGWRRFAKDHFLQAGDVCVFEMIDLRNLIIFVHVFRVWKDGICDGNQTVSEYGRATKRRGKLPQSLAFRSHRGPVTEAERMSAEQAARALEIQNPSFRVTLRKSAVECHFFVSIPMVFANQWLPRRRVRVSLADSTGQSWTATWAGQYKRGRTLRGGWKKFASHHCLEEGDVCVFELINPKKLAFLVHIFPVENRNTTTESPLQGIASGQLLSRIQLRDSAQEGQEPKAKPHPCAPLSRKNHGRGDSPTPAIEGNRGVQDMTISRPGRHARKISRKAIYLAIRKSLATTHRQSKTALVHTTAPAVEARNTNARFPGQEMSSKLSSKNDSSVSHRDSAQIEKHSPPSYGIILTVDPAMECTEMNAGSPQQELLAKQEESASLSKRVQRIKTAVETSEADTRTLMPFHHGRVSPKHHPTPSEKDSVEMEKGFSPSLVRVPKIEPAMECNEKHVRPLGPDLSTQVEVGMSVGYMPSGRQIPGF